VTDLSEAVDDTDAAPDPGPQDVWHEEVHAPALHVTTLAHADTAQRHDQHHQHGQEDQ